MAFFGVTQRGYQDHIREHVRCPGFTPQHYYRAGLYRNPETSRLPPLVDKKDLPSASICPINQTSGYGPGPMGSYKEYTRLQAKHVRNPKDPIDIYRRPVTTAGDIAMWRKDDPIREREPWSYVKRRIHVNSEITKFVDHMSLTNREFTLF